MYWGWHLWIPRTPFPDFCRLLFIGDRHFSSDRSHITDCDLSAEEQLCVSWHSRNIGLSSLCQCSKLSPRRRTVSMSHRVPVSHRMERQSEQSRRPRTSCDKTMSSWLFRWTGPLQLDSGGSCCSSGVLCIIQHFAECVCSQMQDLCRIVSKIAEDYVSVEC